MSVSRFEVVVGGRVHSVHVEPADGPARVRVRIDDGDVIVVDAAVVGSPNAATTWSIRDVATGIVSTAAVALGSSGDGETVVAGHAVPVALANRRRRARAILGAGNGDQRVVAPMPGKVVKVLVAVGDPVEAGQAVCVLEAMKMENNINAETTGTVTEVKVAPGDSVGSGDVVVVIV